MKSTSIEKNPKIFWWVGEGVCVGEGDGGWVGEGDGGWVGGCGLRLQVGVDVGVGE
jgi:hypothetical protein